jgi:uncharacterized protein (TIGR02996 family)
VSAPTAALEAVYEAPDDDGRRLVLADALIDAADPRGDFIQRQAALARLGDGARQRAEAELRSLQRVHGARWAGGLAGVLELNDCTFRLGFLDTAVVSWRVTPAEVRRLAGRPEWRTVRRLAFTWPGPGLDPARRRNPAAVTQYELLRRLPWLKGVSGLLFSAWQGLPTPPRLEAVQVVLDDTPDEAFYRRLETAPDVTRLGLSSVKWAPPLKPAPVWATLLSGGRRQLALEAIGEPGAWARLARRLPLDSLAVRTLRTGNAWFDFRRLGDHAPALAVWLPDAGYFAEGTLRALEELPLTDFAAVTVFTPGALLVENERRLAQALARFGRAEKRVREGRLGSHLVLDERCELFLRHEAHFAATR